MLKGHCTRTTVIAIGADRGNNHVMTCNGNYSQEGCTGEPGNCGCVHAEEEMLRLMPDVKRVTLSHSPCLDCARKMAGHGVEEVNYYQEYRKPDGIEYLKMAGVSVTHLEGGISQ